MSTISDVLHHFKSPSPQLYNELRAVLERVGNPKPVRCTKTLFNTLGTLLDKELDSSHYNGASTLLHVIRYIAQGSHAQASGFGKLLVFGLPQKHMVQWCDSVLSSSPGEVGEWTTALDELFYTTSVILDYSKKAKLSLVPLIPSLLQCITITCLPCSTRIEAVQSTNSLLEVCGVEYKQLLYTKQEIQDIIGKIGHSIMSCGDFELQVAMVECVFRITTVQDRTQLSRQWFPSPAVHQAFGGVRESEFEADCRDFLNLLNHDAGEKRSVHSLPCKRAKLGTLQLLRPRDPGLTAFWVDFNFGSSSMSMLVEAPSSDRTASDGLWDTVVIKETCVKEWALKVQGGDFVLTIALTEPAHTLISSLPPSPSHQVTIVFSPLHDPTPSLQQVFPGKAPPVATAMSSVRAQANTAMGSPAASIKSSIAITPLHISSKTSSKTTPLQFIAKTTPLHKPQKDSKISTASPLVTSRSAYNKQPPKARGSLEQTLKSHDHEHGSHDSTLQEISPIEPVPNTPYVGGHLSSQGSATPPNQAILMATPSTSTPKPRSQLQIVGGRVIKGRQDGPAGPKPVSRLSTSTKNQTQGSRRAATLKVAGKEEAWQDRSDQKQLLKTSSSGGEGKGQATKPCTEVVQKNCNDQSAGKMTAVAKSGRGTSGTLAERGRGTGRTQAERGRGTGRTQAESGRGTGRTQAERGRGTGRTQDSSKNAQLQPEPTGEKKHEPQSKPPGKHLNTSQVLIRDITNQPSPGETAPRQRRLFNLSAAPACGRGKKRSPVSTKTQPKSLHMFDFTDSPGPRCHSHTCASLNSTTSSGPDVIPDSMPLQQSQKRSSHILLSVPRDSYSFDSEVEGDSTWDEGEGAQQGKKTSALCTYRAKNRSVSVKTTAAKNSSVSVKTTAAKNSSVSVKTTTAKNSSISVKTTAAKNSSASVKSTTAKNSSASVKSTAAKNSSVTTAAKNRSVSTTAKNSSYTAAKKTSAGTSAKKSTASWETGDSSSAKNDVPLLSSSRTQTAGGSGGRGTGPDTTRRGKREAPLTDATPSSKRRRLPRPSSGYFSLDSSLSSSSDTSTPIHPPVPPSPSSTLHSSQVQADANLTTEFQRICQTLIAGAGGKSQPHSVSAAEGDALSEDRSQFQEPPDRSQFQDSFNSDGGPQEPASPITLTQLSRDIISKSHQTRARQSRNKAGKTKTSAKTKTVKTSHVTPLTSKRKPLVITTTPTPLHHLKELSLYGETPPADQDSCMATAPVQEVPRPPTSTRKRKVWPRNTALSLAPGPLSFQRARAYLLDSEDGSESVPSVPTATSPSPPPQRTACSSPDCLPPEDSWRPDGLSHELQELMSTYTSKLNTAVKSKRVKWGQFASPASKTAPGQLQRLWEGHKRERVAVLGAFRQQLQQELSVLEAEVQKTHETEKQTMSQLSRQLKSLAASHQTQQKQVERLRALQLSLYEQLEGTEDKQVQQQVSVQRSLKREMQQLQKKLLKDSQRQEVARIRQTLHTMLLQV